MNMKRTLVAYGVMVAALFKEMPTHGQTLHHATTGICGEVAELLVGYVAANRDNVLEELGDTWFYFTKLKLIFGWSNEELLAYADTPKMEDGEPKVPQLARMVIWAGELLDHTKKNWIYGKDIDQAVFKQAAANFLEAFVELMKGLPDLPALTFEEIEKANQEKLAVRYPGLCYTDDAAIARADKAAGETAIRT